ncbi:ABC transporter ATP-binding protein [Mariniluteicoccus endophyticus]
MPDRPHIPASAAHAAKSDLLAKSEEAVLRVRDLRVTYGTTTAVAGVSLDVRAGEVLGVVGESGSGKSTIGLAALGLLPPTARVSGEVLVGDHEMVGLPERAREGVRGGEIAMVFQDALAALNPYRTVGQQIADAHRLRHPVSAAAARARAVEMLGRVGLSDPETQVERYPHEFSGGMRQRAMIAMAVVNEPRVLIADEPTTALDVTVQGQVLQLLRELVDDLGMAMLLVTHDLGVVAETADRVAVMRGGEVVETGPVAQVFTQTAHPYTRALRDATPRIDVPAPPPRAVDDDVVLRLTGVSKTFRSRRGLLGRGVETRAAQDVSLEVRRGETVALVGESGSGKSTVSRIALRLVDPDAGRIEFRGQDITGWSQTRLRPQRRHMAMIFQDPYSSLNPRHRVGQILGRAARVHGLDASPSRIAGLLEQVGLDPAYAERYPHQFSGGQRQRIGIARALATQPSLLIADEPVSALDVSIRAQVMDLLARLRDEENLALLLVSHDLSVVKSVADRVAVMRAGQIVEQGTVAEVYGQPQEAYTRGLLAAVPSLVPVR